MSAIAALKGYRSQFVYSLFYILKHRVDGLIFKPEGIEDLDVLDAQGQLKFVIQVKNLAKPVSLSDILSVDRTSFLRRFLSGAAEAVPVIVSFGQVSAELKEWCRNKQVITPKERTLLQKYAITPSQWLLIKDKLVIEELDEAAMEDEIWGALKEFRMIDPVPTLENLLFWIQYVAEQQRLITALDLLKKIEEIGIYLSERIAIRHRYGQFIHPLNAPDDDRFSPDLLAEEFYYGVNARFTHIRKGIDVVRTEQLATMELSFATSNVLIIHGASGQGKSTLAYRYLADHLPETLGYQIDLQNDPAAANEAILALHSITKGLHMPIILLIDVVPSSTSWLKVIESFSAYKSIRFLVTIRNEDWYRAKTASLRFTFNEIELRLNEAEARQIYQRLTVISQFSRYADFQEAWIAVGKDAPLMEFTYMITHGESLRRRLEEQVHILQQEAALPHYSGQLDLLRLVSLLDHFGARLEISKLTRNDSLQLIIKKFEKEYLVRQTDGGRYLAGLHPVRSKILCDLLFDDLVITYTDVVQNCLDVIETSGLHIFLLNCFLRDLVSPSSLTGYLKQRKDTTWLFFSYAVRAFLWGGIRSYYRVNSDAIEEAYLLYGEAWLMFIDVFHQTNIDHEAMMDLVKMSEEHRQHVHRINQSLSSKTIVFEELSSLFQTVSLPDDCPERTADWRAFAEILFWIAHTDCRARLTTEITEQQFRTAFEQCDLETVSKLMLAMYHYGAPFETVRQELSAIFAERIRVKYMIPELIVAGEITVNYIVDPVDEVADFSLHNQVLSIIDLLRDAFPDKAKFNTQAHGHRSTIIQMAYDDSHKTIPAKNLLLDEWVGLNSTLRSLVAFDHRPGDWQEYFAELNEWQQDVKKIIRDFNEGFDWLIVHNGKKLQPVVQQAHYTYGKHPLAPKLISDPFGIPVFAHKNNAGATQEEAMAERHETFFKTVRNFKTTLENFIVQSGKGLVSLLENRSDASVAIERHLIHLSQVNLFDAVVAQKAMVDELKTNFEFAGFRGEPPVTRNDLLLTATLWNGFLGAYESDYFKKIRRKERVSDILMDMESGFINRLKKIQKTSAYGFQYIRNKGTNEQPFVLIDAPTPEESLYALKLCYDAYRDIMQQPEHTSLKQLMIQCYFPELRVVGRVRGFTLSNQCYRFRWQSVRERSFEQLQFHHLVPQPLSQEEIIRFNLKSWPELYPAMSMVTELYQDYVQMRIRLEHLADLEYFNDHEGIDEVGQEIIFRHIDIISNKMQVRFQRVLDQFVNLLHVCPFDEEKVANDVGEHAYWEDILLIRDRIFPTVKNDEVDYAVKLTFDIIVAWAERLKTLDNAWGNTIMHLQKRFIEKAIAQS